MEHIKKGKGLSGCCYRQEDWGEVDGRYDNYFEPIYEHQQQRATVESKLFRKNWELKSEKNDLLIFGMCVMGERKLGDELRVDKHIFVQRWNESSCHFHTMFIWHEKTTRGIREKLCRMWKKSGDIQTKKKLKPSRVKIESQKFIFILHVTDATQLFFRLRWCLNIIIRRMNITKKTTSEWNEKNESRRIRTFHIWFSLLWCELLAVVVEHIKNILYLPRKSKERAKWKLFDSHMHYCCWLLLSRWATIAISAI